MKTYETVEDYIKSIAESLKPATYQDGYDDLISCMNNLPHAILMAARMVCHAVNKDPERADRLFWEAFSSLRDGFPLEGGVIDGSDYEKWVTGGTRTPPAIDI